MGGLKTTVHAYRLVAGARCEECGMGGFGKKVWIRLIHESLHGTNLMRKGCLLRVVVLLELRV